MIVRTLLALALVACTGSLLAASPPSTSPPGDPEPGRVIYEHRCVSCHGPQGRGDGPEAPFLSPRPASLISAGTSTKSDAELLNVIANGKPRTSMPPWKDLLTEGQQRDVLAYIRSLVRFYPNPQTPPPPERRVR